MSKLGLRGFRHDHPPYDALATLSAAVAASRIRSPNGAQRIEEALIEVIPDTAPQYHVVGGAVPVVRNVGNLVCTGAVGQIQQEPVRRNGRWPSFGFSLELWGTGPTPCSVQGVLTTTAPSLLYPRVPIVCRTWSGEGSVVLGEDARTGLLLKAPQYPEVVRDPQTVDNVAAFLGSLVAPLV